MDAMKKTEMKRYNDRLLEYFEEDEKLTVAERKEINHAIQKLSDWEKKYEGDETMFSHRATNELEMQIVSVNGNTDRNFIHEYLGKMPIKDSTSLRKYIQKNTPGVDYNFEIEKPESLGGGSMSVFLQFDQFIFLVDSE
jgi:hypothetical protein